MRDKVVRWNARSGDPLEHSSLVVLVGPATNDTALAVAAALQDSGRGRVLGRRPAENSPEIPRWYFEPEGDALRLTVGMARRKDSRLFAGLDPDVLPEVNGGRASPGEDVVCPGSVASEPVVEDPLVARALQALSDRP